MVGIYCITNLVNNKKYIGQSINIEDRKRKHFDALKNNRHKNEHLQSSYNFYGKENFTFEVIKECDISELDMYERYYIKEYNLLDSNYGYNYEEGGTSGYHMTDEVKEKIRKAHLGYVMPEETKKKISESRKGKYTGKDNPNYGNHLSETARKKISEANKINSAGSNNGRAILSEDDVYEIRERYKNGEEKQQVYNDYKDSISYGGFSKIWSNDNWKNTNQEAYEKRPPKKRNKYIIVIYDKEENEIDRFNTAKEAAEHLNCSLSKIKALLNGKNKKSKEGYKIVKEYV